MNVTHLYVHRSIPFQWHQNVSASKSEMATTPGSIFPTPECILPIKSIVNVLGASLRRDNTTRNKKCKTTDNDTSRQTTQRLSLAAVLLGRRVFVPTCVVRYLCLCWNENIPTAHFPPSPNRTRRANAAHLHSYRRKNVSNHDARADDDNVDGNDNTRFTTRLCAAEEMPTQYYNAVMRMIAHVREFRARWRERRQYHPRCDFNFEINMPVSQSAAITMQIIVNIYSFELFLLLFLWKDRMAYLSARRLKWNLKTNLRKKLPQSAQYDKIRNNEYSHA